MPLAVEFQPPWLAAIVDSAMLKLVVASIYPERQDGEICVLEMADENLLQISLFFPGELPLHLELRPAWIYTRGFEAKVRERIAAAEKGQALCRLREPGGLHTAAGGARGVE